MTESAARMMTLITSQERLSVAQQPANSAASAPPSSIPSVQVFPASPRNAATPPVLLRNGSSANRTLSTPVADDVALLDKAVISMQERMEELQLENRALAARCAAMDSSNRGVDASLLSPAADAGRLYDVVEALLSNQQATLSIQQATQERHERNLQTLLESLLSNQRSLQDAINASQALAVAACCVSTALLGIVLLRARW